MNRRSFLCDILKAGIGCAILPPALTYARTWKRTETLWVLNPAWKDAPFELDLVGFRGLDLPPGYKRLDPPIRFYYDLLGRPVQIPMLVKADSDEA